MYLPNVVSSLFITLQDQFVLFKLFFNVWSSAESWLITRHYILREHRSSLPQKPIVPQLGVALCAQLHDHSEFMCASALTCSDVSLGSSTASGRHAIKEDRAIQRPHKEFGTAQT